MAAIDLDNDNKPIDNESLRKRKIQTQAINLITRMSGDTNDETWPKELKEIAGSDRKYIAIIHADGNALGQMLLEMQKYFEKNPTADSLNIYKGFSNAIEDATLEAVQDAYKAVILKDFEKKKATLKPARPIVLGGDDVTIIIRADLAFEFTKIFLSRFENTSKQALKKHLGHFNIDLPEMLTACAGIAFVKQAYPFSRACQLAESLCGDAKKIAKEKKKLNSNVVPSCFSFCKISTSIAGDYKTIKERELTSDDKTVKLWFGPYGIGQYAKGLPSFDDLSLLADTLDKVPSGSIRELITTMYSDITTANSDYKRIIQMLRREKKTTDVAMEFEDRLEKLIGLQGSLVSADNCSPLLDAHRYGELRK